MSPRRIGQRISSRARGGFQPRAIIALAVIWVLLWNRISLGNVVNGLIIGAVITQIFPVPSIQYFGRIHPWRLLVLTSRFFVDLVSAAIEVSIATLDRHPPKGGSIVEVHLRVRNELYMTIISALVSLVPGSIVVEARRTANVLYVHGFHVTTPEGLEDLRQDVLGIESRVVRALGSADEIALVMDDTAAKEKA